MLEAPLPLNEKERLAALHAYQVLDTDPEQSFDDITVVASRVCGTPIALVSLVDMSRQWFKSRVGLEAQETPRAVAFCSHAILNPGEILVVPDSFKDERFVDNPLAVQVPHVRSYAGVPLVTHSGMALGTLCVIDDKPRDLTQEQLDTLRRLGSQVVAQLELRQKQAWYEDLSRRIQETKEDAVRSNQETQAFCQAVARELRAPLATASVGVRDLSFSSDRMSVEDQRSLAGVQQSLQEAAGQLEALLELIQLREDDSSFHLPVLKTVSLPVLETKRKPGG